MTTPRNPIQVEFSNQIGKDSKRLRKKYPAAFDDLLELVEIIERGDTPGDRVQGVGYVVFKVRVNSRDVRKGKRGGFRVIYYVRIKDRVTLLTMYAKGERDNVTADEIRELIEEHERTSG